MHAQALRGGSFAEVLSGADAHRHLWELKPRIVVDLVADKP